MSPTSYVWVRLPPSEIALGRCAYFSLRNRSFIVSGSGSSDAKSHAASLSLSVAVRTASLALIWIFIVPSPWLSAERRETCARLTRSTRRDQGDGLLSSP